MSTLIRWWRAWLDRWCALESAAPLAWFRIALGTVVFVDTLSLMAAGVVDPLFVPVAQGGLAPATRFPHLWLWLFTPSVESTWALMGSLLVLSGAVTVGLGGRWVCFALLQAVLLLHALPEDVGGGYDRLLTNGLFLLVLGRSTATWSLDCRWRTGRWTSDEPILALPRYLGIFQLCVVYVVTGFAKGGAGWSYPWDAVFYALQRLPYARFTELTWLGHAYPLTRVGTVVAWWWEVGFLIVGGWWIAHLGWVGETWQRWAGRADPRGLFLGIGLCTHLLLGAVLNLGTFTAVTCCFYLLWIDPPRREPLSSLSERAG